MRLRAAFVCALVCSGQTPEKWEYVGKPLVVSSRCTIEAVQNANLSCTAEQPCPLFLELSEVEIVGNRVIVTGNLHTSSRTLESILLVSEDGGRTWAEPLARIPTAVVDRIQFYDFETGWISGHVMQEQPRDAFFLLTRDGGRTWHKRTVYGESRVGAIEQFFFDSRTHGSMLFDKLGGGETGMRHELYESMTGGESWSIRQVDSKPIPFRAGKTPDAGWRLRVDAKAKAYMIERKQESGWHTVASFLVAAGECAPVEVQSPEQPPDPATPSATELQQPATPKPAERRPPPSLQRKRVPQP